MLTEKYVFNFTDSELKEINKQIANHKKGIALQFIYIFIFLCLSILVFLSQFISDILEAFFIGVLFTYSIIMIISYFQNKKIIKDNHKQNTNRITSSTYQYEFYDDHIYVTIKDTISVRTVHINYSDITYVKNLKSHYVLEYANQNYFLRKSDLIPETKMLTL